MEHVPPNQPWNATELAIPDKIFDKNANNLNIYFDQPHIGENPT